MEVLYPSLDPDNLIPLARNDFLCAVLHCTIFWIQIETYVLCFELSMIRDDRLFFFAKLIHLCIDLLQLVLTLMQLLLGSALSLLIDCNFVSM